MLCMLFIWDVATRANTLYVGHLMSQVGEVEASWGLFHTGVPLQDLRGPCIRWHHTAWAKLSELLTHVLPLHFLIYEVMIQRNR